MTDDSDIVAAARAAMARAHAPYSRFKVGAAVRGESGRIYAGCNVENAAYPQGWCAEASAIAAMVLAGETRIVEAAVMGGGAEPSTRPSTRPCTPCGGCRQKLYEFAGDDLPIHICGTEGPHRTVTLGELLPLAFGPGNLT